MAKKDKLLLGLALLALNCTSKDVFKIFPVTRGLYPVRSSHSGLLPELSKEDSTNDTCGHIYALFEYDTNNNGKTDTYLYYTLNKEDMVIVNDFTFPNIVHYDEDEKGNTDYIWEFTKKGYSFKKYGSK